MTLSPGTLIRIAIVVAWLGLLAHHIVTHALPGFGLTERHDLAATMARQLDRTLTYAVLQDGQRLGSSSLSFQRDDTGFRLDTHLDIELPEGLIPALPIAGGIQLDPRIRVDASQILDDRLRLTGLHASGRLLGMPMSLEARTTVDRLVGTLTIQDQRRSIDVPGLDIRNNQGFDLSISLPPGLVVGDRFLTHLIDLDMLSMSPVQRVAVFAVVARETVQTAHGSLELLKVVMTKGAKQAGISWCDDDGTVFRTDLATGGLRLELEGIDTPGGRLWPKEAPR